MNSVTTLHSPSNSPGGKFFIIVKTKTDDGFHVETRNGAAGKAPKTIPRTKTPVTETEADKLVSALIKKKTTGRSTYQIVPSTDFVESHKTTALIDTNTPFTAPLYAVADPDLYLSDASYLMQTKHDGQRRYVICSEENGVQSYGRYGQPKSIPKLIADTLSKVTGEFDCELVNNTLFIFDQLSYDSDDIASAPFSERYDRLQATYFSSLINNTHIILVQVHSGRSKSDILDKLRADGEEGVVFRHSAAPYKRAITATQGAMMYKYKFYNSASFIVTSTTQGKRSVGISVVDCDTMVSVGKVTIPSNAIVPDEGGIIDVKFRRYNDGGGLIEPTYQTTRDDVLAQHCTLAQIIRNH